MRLEQVTLGYNKHTILRDLSFTISSGEFVFLIGASGCGKSTLIRALIGSMTPMAGHIFNDAEQDIYAFSRRDLERYRRSCGVVFQDYKLLRTSTIEENVRFAMEVCGYSRRTMQERVPEVLAQVGLQDKARSFPHELSGGELQRAAIARALVHHPQTLLADEPTGNLDPQNAAMIVDLFSQLHQQGKTIIFATHDQGIVDRLGKRVISFADGVCCGDRVGNYHS